MANFLLLDGNSLLNRAHYGLGVYHRLTAPDGTPTAAVYAFMQSLLAWLESYQPEKVFVAFDEKGPTFRHDIFPDYKGGREPMDEDLRQQFPLTKDLLTRLGICHLGLKPYEADDLIGTLARKGAAAGFSCLVISGDRDLYQLVDEKIHVLRPTSKGGKPVQYLVTPESFQDEYGFSPEQFIDYRGLVGDSSDGLPGVKGIGKKTARKLMAEYQNLEELYQHLEELPQGQKKNLTNDREHAFQTRELSKILDDLELPLDLEAMDFTLSLSDQARSLLQDLGLARLEERLDEMLGNTSPKDIKIKQEYEFTDEANKRIESFEELLQQAKKTLFYLEEGERARFFTEDLFYLESSDHLSQSSLALIREKGLTFVTHDVKALLTKYKLSCPDLSLFDYKIAAYLIGEGQAENRSFKQLLEAYEIENTASFELAALSLKKLMDEKLDTMNLKSLAYDLEFPLSELLARMEQAGILLDQQALDEYQKELEAALKEVRSRIFLLAGREFNINSTQQLAEVLYEDLALPIGKKTKSGFGSTAVQELQRLRGKHPIIEDLMEQRELSKLLSGFVKALKKTVAKEDGRIHTTFNQMLTATGRLSSEDPNLQNIPIRSTRGRALRRVFIAEPGSRFVSADYSQIELRLLADFSKDEDLVQAFKEGRDIHLETARRLFPEVQSIRSRERAIAKTVNFSIVYGISDYGLSQDLKIAPKEAHQYIEAYHHHYPKVKPWLEAQILKAREDGYVTTMLGRRRALPEIHYKNYNQRQYAERQAMNAPVQGSAADLIKLAMLRVDQRLRKEGLEARILLQIHDELLLEVKEEEAVAVSRILKDEMTHAARLSVPLETSLAIGKDWYDLKEMN